MEPIYRSTFDRHRSDRDKTNRLSGTRRHDSRGAERKIPSHVRRKSLIADRSGYPITSDSDSGSRLQPVLVTPSRWDQKSPEKMKLAENAPSLAARKQIFLVQYYWTYANMRR